MRQVPGEATSSVSPTILSTRVHPIAGGERRWENVKSMKTQPQAGQGTWAQRWMFAAKASGLPALGGGL